MIFNSPFPDRAIPEMPYHALILQKAMERKDQPALIDGPSGRTLTLGQIAGGARLVASSLAKRGFGKGDVFAIYLPNVPEYAIAFHGGACVAQRGSSSVVHQARSISRLSIA